MPGNLLEIFQELPAIEDLQIDVGDNIRLSEVGKVTSVVGVLGKLK
jgi:hypothetical protein